MKIIAYTLFIFTLLLSVSCAQESDQSSSQKTKISQESSAEAQSDQAEQKEMKNGKGKMAEPKKNKPSKTKEVNPVKNEDISEIIKNPISARNTQTKEKGAILEFDESIYDFGVVMEGDTVSHAFQFKNTGEKPLLITDARSTCGCTVPSWPKEPIPPGETGMIRAVFNTKGKLGRQTKPITVYANTVPNSNVVKLVGIVDTER